MPAAMWRAAGCDSVDRKRRCAPHGRRRGNGLRQHETRQAKRQRRLADAVRPADQPGMRTLPAPIGIEQHGLRVPMAVERHGLTRQARGERCLLTSSCSCAVGLERLRLAQFDEA